MYYLTAVLMVFSIIEAYVSSHFALSFALSGISGLILLLEIGCIIYLVVKVFKKKEIKFTLLVVLSIVIFFFSHKIAGQHSSRLSQISRTNGDKIINAVEAFKKEVGKLPKELNELVPKYLDSIPIPGFKGSQYYYILNKERNSYKIRYDSIAWLQCERTANSKWGCSD